MRRLSDIVWFLGFVAVGAILIAVIFAMLLVYMPVEYVGAAVSVQVVLYILGTIGLLLEAFGARVPFVSLGWLGLTLIAVGALLLPAVG